MNRNKYFKEVDELIKKNEDLIKEDFELLYLSVSGVKMDVNISYLADKIIRSLNNNVDLNVLNFWEFLQTEIGRAIVKAKFKLDNDIYFVDDVKEITGFSREFILEEIKSKNIKYEKRNSEIFFTGDNIREYLSIKNIDKFDKEIEERYEEQRKKLINGIFKR
ncbi:hypothetical protein CPAST_c23520 [Clostridium pasteurianum DSM 525 = ATCC 6013]|uniref:Uncharacterized protein n=1 Tax=Clostridium pasteurianum DSM 525 = ATCC 6013 TaxID=1262449 RepID=A0A0H3J5E8_CLOPA|nr:hypothetical protein [Clostridium pasteurianum]AJA48422.1 hypothetical protein CPAST_c23520 [Clostridium pasteurianum DSM 525 = ATCC 6013]AJA52410.1 hypothetical protein CLPA_c23520 [Clostridium pasteurianum DSM 525 = ATCC 6013]AOZ75667.1 hypothetical protein AQ983_11435 [Clostridium pasteurianum DSM 525 = ATCC 6013]AOZ79463.1 hypothetical protein AQ984_11430 [Clostridium pasteurianum]ELP60428.1 hypothetical protein F502_03047 [Clostridium pasteurianum DSM 525 = ATCC 6013]